MINQWTPIPEGTIGHDRLVYEPLPVMQFSQNLTLTDYVSLGKWFYYFPCLCWFGKPVDPLADFLPRRNDLTVQLCVSEAPMFSGDIGLSFTHWHHALLWCDNQSWPTIRDHLLASVIVDSSRGLQYHLRECLTTVPDTLQMRHTTNGASIQQIPVTLFAPYCVFWETIIRANNNLQTPTAPTYVGRKRTDGT